jgi:hypothetical protein
MIHTYEGGHLLLVDLLADVVQRTSKRVFIIIGVVSVYM